MKRYLRGWIYSKMLDGRKLILLGSFLLFYAGLYFNLPSLDEVRMDTKTKDSQKICLQENLPTKPAN